MIDSSPSTTSAAETFAVLVLDPAGRVSAASAPAAALWQLAETALIGAHFATLFAFEIFSSDPDFLEAQWDVLQASALGRSAPLQLQPRAADGAEPPAPRDIRLRLDPLLGPAPGFIATIQPPPAPVAAVASNGGAADERLAAYSLFADKSPAGFFDLHLAAGQVWFSPAWKRIVGYADAELPNALDTWAQLIHPDDSGAAPDKPGKKAVPGTRAFSVEFRMKHRLGRWVWIQCVGVQSISASGQLDRVVGLHLDITDRKEIEEASVANDARLQDLSGGGPLAAFELDFFGQIFWYSPAFGKLLGYDEGELAASPSSFAAVLPAEEASGGLEPWLLARAPGQNTFVEAVKLRAKDGRPVPVLLGALRSVTRKRELSRVVGFACPLPADLSAASGEATLSPLLVNESFGAVAEGVLVTDARGKVIYLSSSALRLLKLTSEQAIGHPLRDIFRIVNRQSGRPSDDPAERALSADKPLPLISDDALAPAIEGETARPVVWTARVAFGEDGKARGVVVVFRDPEELTLTPDELVRANRFESLGLLAGGIAHDFNNLLTTILGAVSLAKDNRDYTSLADAEKACLTAKGLTKQLLAFAKGGSGTQIVADTKEILEDSIKIAAAASVAVITLDVPEGTQPVLVDRAQILQVFQNLIVNALQAMPPAPHQPRLQIHAHNLVLGEEQVPGLPAGDYVEFEVRDNGSGIKPEYVEKIFDPFFTTKKHGTGLGLATVLSIVRKHAGQIGLDTQVGVGTAFTVYLPKATEPVALQPRRAPSLRFGTGRVLFMDDDPKISALTATMLQSLDYKFDMAKNGEEAIVFYKRYQNIGRPYDAVIMDLTVVGGMGGEDCYKALKALDPEVRAIVSSGYDNDDMARKYYDMGFLGYLAKPYRVTDLGKVLKQVLG